MHKDLGLVLLGVDNGDNITTQQGNMAGWAGVHVRASMRGSVTVPCPRWWRRDNHVTYRDNTADTPLLDSEDDVEFVDKGLTPRPHL